MCQTLINGLISFQFRRSCVLEGKNYAEIALSQRLGERFSATPTARGRDRFNKFSYVENDDGDDVFTLIEDDIPLPEAGQPKRGRPRKCVVSIVILTFISL